MDRMDRERIVFEAIQARREGKRVVRNGKMIVGTPKTGYQTEDGHIENEEELEKYLSNFYVLEKPFIILTGPDEDN